jgi:hypothetical protein
MKLLLDNNVWTYLSQHMRATELRDMARKHRVTILACPAVLYEILRSPPSAKADRDRTLALVAAPYWERMMPEVYSECMEFLGEARRLRPDWLVPKPDTRKFEQLRKDWISAPKGTWWRARYKTDFMAAWIGGGKDDRIEIAREDASKLRQKFLESRVSTATPSHWGAHLQISPH